MVASISSSNGLFEVKLAEVGPTGATNPIETSIMTEAGITETGESDEALRARGCTDGKDDGRLGLGEAVGSFFKGLVKPITTLFENPGNFITGALTIAAGAALIAVTGGAATPFLIGAGVAMGTYQFGHGVVKAVEAYNDPNLGDADAKAAIEDIGTGTFMLGSSLFGAKKYQSSVAGEKMGMFKSLAKTLKPSNLKAEGLRSLSNIKISAKNLFSSTKTPLLKFGEVTQKTSTKTKIDAETKPKNSTDIEENVRDADYDEYMRQRQAAEAEIDADNKVTTKETKQTSTHHPDTPEAAQEAAADAVKRLENGESYGEVRKDATKNFSKENKRIIQDELRKAQDSRLAAEQAQTQENINNSQTVKKAAGQTESTSQRMNTVETVEQVDSSVQRAESVRADAQARTDALAQEAQNNPTHQNKLNARRAQNQLTELEADTDKLLKSAEVKKQEIISAAEKKAADTQSYLDRTTPEQRAAQQLSNEAAQIKSQARAINQKLVQPRYQRAYIEYQKKGISALETLTRSSKTNDLEKQIAQFVLATKNAGSQFPASLTASNLAA